MFLPVKLYAVHLKLSRTSQTLQLGVIQFLGSSLGVGGDSLQLIEIGFYEQVPDVDCLLPRHRSVPCQHIMIHVQCPSLCSPWLESDWTVMGWGRIIGNVFQCHKMLRDRSSRGLIAAIMSGVRTELRLIVSHLTLTVWDGLIVYLQRLSLWLHLLHLLRPVEPVQGGV